MQHAPLSYDYVLVAKTIDKQEREAFRKQNEYIEELKKKKMKVTVSVNFKNILQLNFSNNLSVFMIHSFTSSIFISVRKL